MLLVTLACLSGVCVSAHNIPHRRWDEREECQWKLTPGSVPLVPVPSATVCDRVVGKATHCVGASIKWGGANLDQRKKGGHFCEISPLELLPLGLAPSRNCVPTLPVYSSCVLQIRLPGEDSTFQLERVGSEEETGGCQGFLARGGWNRGRKGQTDARTRLPVGPRRCSALSGAATRVPQC